jgi:hypothetical protein
MKRTTPQRRHSVRTSDPFKNLSLEQLSYIGAITLLYNDVEAIVNSMCALALRIQIRHEELTSRINGMDGKLALIKLGAGNWGFDAAEMNHLEDVLGAGGFKLMKTWRDAIIHAQVLDARASVGKGNERQGRVYEVLMSLDALKGFYTRLDVMRVELNSIRAVLARKQTLTLEELKEFEFELDDQDREQLEQGIQDDWAQAREHRTQRQSLPPIPEFPEEPSALQSLLGLPESLSEYYALFPALMRKPGSEAAPEPQG